MIINYQYETLRGMRVEKVVVLLNKAQKENNIPMINKCNRAIRSHGWALGFDVRAREYFLKRG